MAERNNGGPAYPCRNIHMGTDLGDYQGLTVRQYYKALALQGMLAHSTRYKPRPHEEGLHWHDAIAREAGELADAMLAEDYEAQK